MKFSGNISFIDIMILSKFQVDYITLTNFRNLLNIGKFREICNFRKILVYKKCRQSAKNDFFLDFFLQILFIYIDRHQKSLMILKTGLFAPPPYSQVTHPSRERGGYKFVQPRGSFLHEGATPSTSDPYCVLTVPPQCEAEVG